MVKFLVLALFYGDHPELARRCGASLRALWNTGKVDVRVGFNEVSPRTRAVIDALLPGVHCEAADPQIYKYPMMRRLLAGYRGDATHLMWFDDDSCLLPGTDANRWLQAVSQRAASVGGSLGALYKGSYNQLQKDWVRSQTWFTGREVPDEMPFTVGGWFTAPLDLLRRCDWPDATLYHAGGDMGLGALLYQQGLVPEHFRAGLAINADAQLRDAASPRRGVDEPRQVDG
ncbi:MAG: hypothetical protein EOO24_34090, partial [Comamonadaceae bacterium]